MPRAVLSATISGRVKALWSATQHTKRSLASRESRPAAVGAAGDTHKGGRPAQWWPEHLNLKVLHQTSAGCGLSDPNKDFDYAAAFEQLDLGALRADLLHLMTDSQEWWPADYGSYAGFFIRLAW